MAKIKNTGHQPRGFNTEEGGHVVVKPGEEAEFNMTEADFKHLQGVIENADDPKPFEISGSHGGVKAKKEKKDGDEVEMPAQSTEPPSSQPHQEVVAPVATPLHDKEKREQVAKQKDKEEAPTPRR